MSVSFVIVACHSCVAPTEAAAAIVSDTDEERRFGKRKDSDVFSVVVFREVREWVIGSCQFSSRLNEFDDVVLVTRLCSGLTVKNLRHVTGQ